jgi:D-aminoacyl-tRNA deacylase
VRAVVQRTGPAQVSVDGEVVGRIDHGLVVFLGVADGDSQADADYLAAKIAGLRIFQDDDGRMNRSVVDAAGGVLVISQFTLLGDARKGRRPSFVAAAAPEKGEPLYEYVADRLAEAGIPVARGRFGAHMQIAVDNDGPVTILLDSRKLF